MSNSIILANVNNNTPALSGLSVEDAIKQAYDVAHAYAGHATNEKFDSKLRKGTLVALLPVIFAAPVTTAQACAVLGLEVSVKGVDKEEKRVRAYLQCLRMTVQSSLKAADLWMDAGTGKGAPKVKTALDKIQALLPELTAEEYDTLLNTFIARAI